MKIIMKRKLLFTLPFLVAASSMLAQGEMDAYKLSRNDLTGTARSISMGGAFGALGGDISAISINPAGIGVYKSSEIVSTLNFQNTSIESELNAGKVKNSKFKVTFDNLAFVSAFPVNSDVAPFVNFGFSYNRLKSFDRQYQMRGDNLQGNSIASYMAGRATNNSSGKITDPMNQIWIKDNYNPFADSNYDWMAITGFNSYLIDHKGNGEYAGAQALLNNALNKDLFVREKGHIDTYDFSLGTTFSDIVSAGISLSVTDLKYDLSSNYEEQIIDKLGSGNGFSFNNDLRTEGTGWQLGLGLIIKPVQELRIGVAYHSPTWYNMTDYYYGMDMNYDLSAYLPSSAEHSKDKFGAEGYDYDYKMRTPDKWTFSLAGVIGQSAIVSADYELTNYGNMNLKDPDGNNYEDHNGYIKNHFRASSTLRVGAEIRITPQFSGRIGYAWVQSPMKKEFKDGNKEVMTVGTVAHYTLDGDTNYFTYGLGYRFTRNFYTDVAFVMSNQKDDLYAYYGSEKTTLKTNRFQGLLTLGYKF